MGYTLTHEHLSLHVDRFYTPCPEHLKGYVTDRKKISLDNLGVLRQYPYSSRYNIIFNDEEAHEKVVEDLKLLKQWCGSNCTIFENTTHGIHRDLEFCREAATRTGVNVVAGTGHYIESAQRASDLSVSLEALSDLYTKELVAGVDVSISQNGSDIIKCGFIGEVGSTWPITGNVDTFFFVNNKRQINTKNDNVKIYQLQQISDNQSYISCLSFEKTHVLTDKMHFGHLFCS